MYVNLGLRNREFDQRLTDCEMMRNCRSAVSEMKIFGTRRLTAGKFEEAQAKLDDLIDINGAEGAIEKYLVCCLRCLSRWS
eukprot:SAG11_NODE_510_length_8851_cov_25.360718_6_plen_81_part_00